MIVGEKPPEDPPVGGTSIRMGAAVLRPHDEEKGHYALFRPLILVRNDGRKVTREQLPNELGPLAIYRQKRNGDKDEVALRTSDPKTGAPMDLILVWRPGMG